MSQRQKTASRANAVEGKVVYILILVLVFQFGYPITENGSQLVQILYQSAYSSLIIAGIVVARDNKRMVRILSVLGYFGDGIYIRSGGTMDNLGRIYCNCLTPDSDYMDVNPIYIQSKTGDTGCHLCH
jgi:hypothetical protein